MSFLYGIIELYDGGQKADQMITWRKAVVLGCNWHGYSHETIGFIIKKFIEDARQYYQSEPPESWDGFRVGVHMVTQSGKVATPKGMVQTFYIDPDDELGLAECSLWRVFLGPEPGAYRMRGYRVRHDVEKRIRTALIEMDWRKGWRENEQE